MQVDSQIDGLAVLVFSVSSDGGSEPHIPDSLYTFYFSLVRLVDLTACLDYYSLPGGCQQRLKVKNISAYAICVPRYRVEQRNRLDDDSSDITGVISLPER